MENHVSSLQPASRRRGPVLSAVLLCLVFIIALFTPFRAQAQGCALCYTQAASSGSRMIRALRSGILILVIPPTLMSLGVILVAYAKRNQFRSEDSVSRDPEPDLDQAPALRERRRFFPFWPTHQSRRC